MEVVTDFLVSKLLESLYNMAKEELTRQLGLVDDVNKLQSTLEALQGYLQDAEKKSIEDVGMDRWLKQIKDVVYDIEDLVEEYAALKVDDFGKSISSSDENSSSSSTKVSCNFSILSYFKKVASKRTISVQIEDLNKKLKDQIMSQIPILGLMRSYPTSNSLANQVSPNQLTAHMTNSRMVRSDIVGNIIDDDARRLAELLTQEDNRDNPLVYAIVGMGGIGKTTLAKLVFDDQRIQSRFEKNVWVSVSQNYSEIDILRTISRDTERCHNLSLLSEKVEDIVRGKKLFMVLDDMWETERVWNGLLRSLLKSGAAKGSRVLVTTRNKEVADRMMAVHSHQVDPLHQEDGWLLLCKSAFPAWEQQEANDDLWNLKDIGEELVKKCDGLPLAINVIGGMLSEESKTREAWELVLKSSLWEVNGLPKEIHSALYISYQYLPTNIKQCFLYCSLFPKGRYFSVTKAQDLWIQEGFIKDEPNASSYDVAERYLRILVQKNLLKFEPRTFSTLFTMHDLFYSLCQFLMQNESLVSTEEKNLNYQLGGRTMKLRRLSFICDSNKSTNILLKRLREQVSLRTLLIFDKSVCKIDNDLFNHLLRLRILWLQGTNVTELPESLGALKLLRYLNLSETPIRELPNSIQKLKNLRILNVSKCLNLYNLPSCIMNLHHLSSISAHHSALEYLPPGLGRLNELQILVFNLPRDIGQESSTLEDLRTLTQLRFLYLCNLERVLDRSQAKSASLKDKYHLRTLDLACSESDYDEVLMQTEDFKEFVNLIEEIFEDLCPPPQLQNLKIRNYEGRKLPSWLGHASFNSLLTLLISGCSNCKQLDGLGLLPNLEKLSIKGASSIKNIGVEFYTGNGRSNIEKGALEPPYEKFVFLPRIMFVEFQEMDSWEEWSCLGKAIPVMPHLEILQILMCPKLKSFPEELLHHAAASLKKIRIRNASELLLKVVQNLPRLEILSVENIPNLERISALPALQQLWMKDCPGIKLVELTHRLQLISWKDLNTNSLPEWFSTDGRGDDNKLKANYLEIICKEELVSKICFKEEYEWSKIQHFDQVDVWNEDECSRLAYSKNLGRFTVYPDEKQEKTSLAG